MAGNLRLQERMTFPVSMKMKNELHRRAQTEEVSVSHLIRQALRALLNEPARNGKG
jgi:hypothetical protein